MLLAFFCLISPSIEAESIVGQVVGVSDGDTITLLDKNNSQYKVRLAGIDAPEKKQAFGNASKKFLSNLIFSKQVIADWSKRDRYGRLVAKITLNDKDINLLQIEQGMAWFYFKYQNELNQEDRIKYVQAHQNSENNKIGLWADSLAEAPWDFRKRQKK
ncbi:MAG: thermonuclease family protein [Methylotenera sp.]|nr:thermonuclease family protein [Methylotenera sp.]